MIQNIDKRFQSGALTLVPALLLLGCGGSDSTPSNDHQKVVSQCQLHSRSLADAATLLRACIDSNGQLPFKNHSTVIEAKKGGGKQITFPQANFKGTITRQESAEVTGVDFNKFSYNYQVGKVTHGATVNGHVAHKAGTLTATNLTIQQGTWLWTVDFTLTPSKSGYIGSATFKRAGQPYKADITIVLNQEPKKNQIQGGAAIWTYAGHTVKVDLKEIKLRGEELATDAE